MLKRGLVVVAWAVLGAACSSSIDADDGSSAASGIDCEVAVVGGGAGGLHTAYRLAPTLGSRVCLFEKEAELGGRIHDVTFDGKPDSPRIGVGARRVMEGQEVLFNLAKELGLELESPPNGTDLVQARSMFSYEKDAIWKAKYPSLAAPTKADKDQETWLYDQLRTSPERANAAAYSFEAYTRKVIGDEGWNFLRDMSRFRADFEYPLDARGYLDYLDEEWDVCCQPSYPIGGMSAFIRGMEAQAHKAGARLYANEPVSAIDKRDGRYVITTSKRTVEATKVVIAVPPTGFEKIGGDVADRIKARSEYQSIVGVKVVTITQWWPYSWWKDIKNPQSTENAQTWRAWTTEHCLNFIEIPINPYAVAQNVTRSAYVDNAACATYWEDLAKQGNDKVEAELAKGLTALFNNGVSVPATITIPKPTKTFVQVWPAGWYWLKSGASITNAQLAEWAIEPLAGESVGLVGEAYNVQRSGWSDGAYKSSIHLLNAKYGANLAGSTTRTLSSHRFMR
jgi:protoporphyrinogen oxidase